MPNPAQPFVLQPQSLFQESADTALTAHSGGTQAAALQLVSEINVVTTVAAAGDSVALPPWAAGLTIVIWNKGANPLQVYGSPLGAGTDTINGAAAATGVSQMVNSICIYVAGPSGLWACENVAQGFAGQYPTNSYATGLMAHSGGGQANALKLTAVVNKVATVAAQGDSVALPPSAAGMAITVINRGANAMQVFGDNTAADTINGITTGTGISQGVGQVATYFCEAAGNWDVQFSQPQQAGIVALSGSTDAIPPHVAHTYVVTKAGVDAMTLAAPTATTDDGLIITITSNTANAHTLTATGLLETGTASVNVATFAAQKGAGLTLMAYQAKWIVLAAVGITFS